MVTQTPCRRGWQAARQAAVTVAAVAPVTLPLDLVKRVGTPGGVHVVVVVVALAAAVKPAVAAAAGVNAGRNDVQNPVPGSGGQTRARLGRTVTAAPVTPRQALVELVPAPTGGRKAAGTAVVVVTLARAVVPRPAVHHGLVHHVMKLVAALRRSDEWCHTHGATCGLGISMPPIHICVCIVYSHLSLSLSLSLFPRIATNNTHTHTLTS